MTVSTPRASPPPPATVATTFAMIEEAKRGNYTSGVIGLMARPDLGAEQDVTHDGQLVRIRAAESALAVREALLEHVEGDWMVVLTDRTDDDLGAGVLAHFAWQRLRRPDPWEAVRHRFQATGVDPALTTAPGNRELAVQLLAAAPDEGWPAAPAGVLTRAHALGAAAHVALGLAGDVVDAITVLDWAIRPQSVQALADLRSEHGDTLADALLDWLAENSGTAAAPVRALLARGNVADLVPVGLVAHLLTNVAGDLPEQKHQAELGLARLDAQFGQPKPSPASIAALGAAAAAVITDLAQDPLRTAHLTRVLARAETLLQGVEATHLAIHSDLLPRGYLHRLGLLAEALRRGIDDMTKELVHPQSADASQAVESAWGFAARHRLGRSDSPEVGAFSAAVRLWRWLNVPDREANSSLAATASAARRHLDHDAWADAAINDAATGVDDGELADALRRVVEAAMRRRDEGEREFASGLAAVTSADAGAAAGGLAEEAGTVWYLEALLPKVVLPMARRAPLLLLVMDGMSAAAATEILTDATGRLGWIEAALPDPAGGGSAARRAAAFAVLPSLTEVSRASLLCGRLTRGQQGVELSGYGELTAKVGKIRAQLFHKKGVDTTTPGALLSGVGTVIDDPGVDLVTVVLNTIDDALDRSDPSGTVWTADAVRHLEPLLARARAAGRTVVMTADHGHVVERRMGTMRPHPEASSNRSRPVSGIVGDDEVVVSGRRVLTDDGRAVLAVSEGLRYGPLKAGYHGGASAAEVVVPVAVLVPDEATNPLGLPLLPPQTPSWWDLTEVASRSTATVATQPSGIRASKLTRKPEAPDLGPTLFDHPNVAVTPPAAGPTLGGSVIASEVYAAQRKVSGRVIVTDGQLVALVDALSSTPSTRLPMTAVASALAISEVRLRGALAQLAQLLNVEGYAVIETDPHTRTVILNERLLRDQFGVH